MRISAGKLDRRATLYSPTTTRADNGEALETFTEVGKRWCSVMSLLPSEVELQAQLSGQAALKVLMRHDSLTRTIAPTWRVAVDETEYEVTGTDPNQPDGSQLVYLAGLR